MIKPEVTNDRPIDRAFAKIWEYYHIDQQEDIDTGWCNYVQTKIAILAAVKVAMSKHECLMISDGNYLYPVRITLKSGATILTYHPKDSDFVRDVAVDINGIVDDTATQWKLWRTRGGCVLIDGKEIAAIEWLEWT